MLRLFDLAGRDAIYGVRQLVRARAFALAAIASLALGLAVNTVTFSVINAVLLRPLAGSAAGDIVRIGRTVRNDGSFRAGTYRDYRFLRANVSRLSDVFGEQVQAITLGAHDGAAILSGEIVTDNYFSALGVTIALGRGFLAEDDRAPGGSAVAVISDGLWRQRFGADESIVGRPVTINTQPFTIVGVAPRRFSGTFPGVSVDVWIPAAMAGQISPDARANEQPSLMLMGRLRPGEAAASAAAELNTLAWRLAEEDPASNRDRGFILAPARGAHPLVARFIGTFLWLLLGIVWLVLLIACANVASLLLARATARRGEIAARLALGASRSRLVAQLITESLVLAAAGGGAGIALSVGALRLINTLVLIPGPTGAPIFMDLQLDVRVLAFSAAAAMAAALAFGVVPAVQATKVDVMSGLKGVPSSSEPRRSRLHGVLVMTQVALSATLLIAAVILSRSLLYASRSDVGFRPDGLVLASFNVDLPGYDAVRAGTFYDALLERVRRLPGVQRAALADFVPMGDRGSSVELTSPDAASIDTRQGLRAAYNRVSDEYLATIGQPVLRGREFTDRDREPAPPVAIVNETLARRYWPDGSAIGKHIQVEGEAATREVVGIAANARYASFGGEVGPFVLLPARQRSGFQLTLHLRAASTAPPVLSDVVRLAREIDPAVALQKGTTMREAMGFSLLPAQVARTVFAVAGLVGLALASCGLFGLVSYTCEQRLKEIGVMVALGASRKRVLGAVVGGTFMFVFSGLAAGTVLAAAAMHVFRALLYGVTSWDLTTMAGVVMVLAGVALASSVAAARKGLNVDPVVALRHH